MPSVDPILLAALPKGSRKTFASLLPAVVSSELELRAHLVAYARQVERAAARNEFVDLALARAIGERLTRLIGDWASLTDPQRMIVHAAIAYCTWPLHGPATNW